MSVLFNAPSVVLVANGSDKAMLGPGFHTGPMAIIAPLDELFQGLTAAALCTPVRMAGYHLIE